MDELGKVHFSDRLCSETAERYEMKAPLQSWQTKPPSTGENELLKQFENNKKPQQKSTAQTLPKGCKSFTRTQLRNLRVKEEFKSGIPKHEISKRFGTPDRKDVKSGNRERWLYRSDRVSRTFNFLNECLVNWKEHWKKPKSKLSKYNQ